MGCGVGCGVDFCLYASVLDVERCAEGSFEFLGCGVGCGVDFCLYASVLDAERCAEGVLSSWVVVWGAVLTLSVCFGVGCGTLCRLL